MKLKLDQKFKSLEPFNIDLPNFVVLTGVNGAGKTHLLTAIVEKFIKIYDDSDIELDPIKHVTSATLIPGQSIPNIELTTLNLNGKNTWQRFQNNLARKNYLVDGVNFTHRENILIEEIAKKAKKSKEALIADEFFLFYPIDDNIYRDIFHHTFSYIFKRYLEKIEDNEYREFRKIAKKQSNVTFLSKQEFEKTFGEAPWDLVNKIFKEASFDYHINLPKSQHEETVFELKLVNNYNGNEIRFEDLSSGEKVLMSLILALYNSNFDVSFPKVLLMDEPDSSLHPSLIKQFLDIIQKVFVQHKGVKVIITTHSPTTVALAPEESIFVVSKTGKRVEKQTKKNALNILSEGFITLEEGLHIFDQIARKELSIFTEGNNINYIKTAIELRNPSLLDKIDIVDKLKDRTGKTQLSVLFDFFSKMPHKNKVLFVYDCDVKTQFEETAETFGFIFEQNSHNTKVLKGIENLFDQNLFTDAFYPKKRKEDGGYQASLEKNNFEKFILERRNVEDFNNFDSLILKIQEILKV